MVRRERCGLNSRDGVKSDRPEELLADNWRRAASDLNIRVVVPYTLVAFGKQVDCVAFLPDFGSPFGMVIGLTCAPDFETSPELVHLAQERKLFYSFINPESYLVYHRDDFISALRDWGYYGAPEERPSWL